MTYFEFTREMQEAVIDLLRTIDQEGRSDLLEHEVYKILEIIGIKTPVHRVVRSMKEVDEGLLRVFKGSRVIVKVISKHIPHKSRVNGVARVESRPDAVADAIDRMSIEIPLDPAFKTEPEIYGYLICDYIDYSKELGNEILLGIRENMAFGPVVSLSKGGNDAEHFAKHYSKPNLMLTPLNIGGARQLLENTKIIVKYIEEENYAHIEKLTEHIFRLSQLSSIFSSFARKPLEFVLTDFEINPIIFTPEGELVAIDGLGKFMRNEKAFEVITEPNTDNLEALFEPEGVAVAGVSARNPSKLGNIIATLLHDMDREDLYLLNPKGGAVKIGDKDYTLYESLEDVEGPVELVIVMVPAPLVPEIVRQAVAKKVKALVLIPGGFSEVSGDRTVENQILDLVKGTGMRLVGPNCLGIFYAPTGEKPGINTIFVPKRKLNFAPTEGKERNVALITQSGALGVTILDKLKYALCPRIVVSYGNQIEVDPGDLVAYLDKDDEIDVIAAYVEGFHTAGGREFFNVARKIKKPLIIYKAGRTDAGSRAAASHTASMTGDYEVARAAFVQAGIINAESLLEHIDLVKTFALLGGKSVQGASVAGVFNAGFESTYAADNLGRLNLADFTSRTVEALREILPPFVAVQSFLDLTPMGDDDLYEQCLKILLEDENVDSLVVSMLPHTVMLHTTRDEIEANQENVATRILRQSRTSNKPVVVCINASSAYDTLVNMLEDGGVPTFTSVERAMFCLDKLVAYSKLAE
ncbi:MAG: acetate--CoA ligase family protein [Planctomycetota bacterium]|jgi:acyl-CoA synthetase (NDP forming)